MNTLPLRFFGLIAFMVIVSFLVSWSPFVALGMGLATGFSILAFLKPYYALYAIVCFIPLVDLFSYKLVSQEYAVMMRFSSELMVGVLFLAVVLKKLGARKKMHFPKELGWLFIFILAVVISAVLNEVPGENFIFGFTIIIRYILLFYTVSLLDWPKKKVKTLYLIILGIAAVQILIGLGQAVFGESFRNLFSYDTKLSFTSSSIYVLERQVLDSAWVFGTFSRYNLLGGFLMLCISMAVASVMIVKKHSQKIILGLLIVSSGIVMILTNSRSSWIGAFAGVITIFILLKKNRAVMFFIGTIMAVVISLIFLFEPVSLLISESAGATPLERFVGMFSGEYIHKSLQNDRLFLITKASQQVVAEVPFLGVGMGQAWSSQEAAFGDFKYGLLLGLPVESWYYLGDVGWIALFSQVGFLGLIPFVIFIWFLFQNPRKILSQIDGVEKMVVISFLGMWMSVVITNIWSFNFTYRATSFYFWLIGGVVFSLIYQKKREQKEAYQ